MATSIHNPSNTGSGARYRDDAAMSTTGWVVALVVLALIVLFGIFVWPGTYSASAPAASTNNAVTAPLVSPAGSTGASGSATPSGQGATTNTTGNTSGNSSGAAGY